MRNCLKTSLLTFLIVTFFVINPLLETAFAQSTTAETGSNTSSACAVTKVGNPKITPVFPPECSAVGSASAIEGLKLPPNLTTCFAVAAEESGGKAGEYCKMPPSQNNSYKSYGTDWGSKEMIAVLYTVAQNWKAKYPNGYLIIGDISADNHKTHFWGIAVDLTATTNGKDRAANMLVKIYNREATINLGKMIVDTGIMDTIWYNDATVRSTVFAYAKSKHKRFTNNSSGQPGLRYLDGHANHFHLNIDRARLFSNSSPRNLDKSKLKRCTNVGRNIC